jgi:hypothetical protein
MDSALSVSVGSIVGEPEVDGPLAFWEQADVKQMTTTKSPEINMRFTELRLARKWFVVRCAEL